MADRTPLRAAKPIDVADDDPFAELTRIMGFDPRVPAKPQESSLRPVATAASEDFEIDLEKELMGEFGGPEDVQGAHADHAQPEVHEFDALDLDFDTDFVTPQQAQGSGLHAGAEERRLSGHDREHAASEQDVFDAAVAHSFADNFQPEVEPGDSHFGDFSAANASAGEVAATDGRLNADIASDWAESFIEAEPVQHFDFDDDLDHAIAEGHARSADGVDQATSEHPAEVMTASRAGAYDGHGQSDPFEDGLEFDLENELDSVSRASETQASHAAAPVVDNAVEMAPQHGASERETTLEDELSALLNRMSAKPAISSATAEVLQVPQDASDALDQANWASDGRREQLESQGQAGGGDADFEDFASELEKAGDADIEFDHDAFAAALNEDIAGLAEAHPAAVEVSRSAFDTAAAPHAFAPYAMPAEPVQNWNRGAPVVQSRPAREAVPAYRPTVQETAATSPVARPSASTSGSPRLEMPEVETVEVPERLVALNDDLNIPDIVFEEKEREAAAYDDIDADFAGLLSEMNDAEPATVASRAKTYDDDVYNAGFKHDPLATPAYAEQRTAAMPAGVAAAAYAAATPTGFAAGSAGMPVGNTYPVEANELDYDPGFDEEMSVPDAAEAAAARQPRSRGVLVAAVVGAVAVIGGVGALALSSGGKGSSGTPVLVKADSQPIKVKPENPGGAVIPNQDNKVYDVVAHGAKSSAPEQKNLVADAEEPVDVTARVQDSGNMQPAAGEETTGQKSEARLLPTDQKAETSDENAVAAVAPRKVRTMIVKPDGTLVPRDDSGPAADVAASEPADPAPQHVVNASTADQTGTVPQSADAGSQKSTAGNQTPATAPVAPQRPAEQAVDTTGEPKPEKVASIVPENGVSGGWSMQIASQPSAESAQSTYQDLARRYGSVLSGHGVSIVKAEIAGKGTFYRVRVPAKTRDEAINLCTNYKAAGGNCFVSK